MIKRFAGVAAAVAFGLSLFAIAQAAPPIASAPNASSAVVAPKATDTKVGTINIEQAVLLSNEGRRDFGTLEKKFLPKQNELKGLYEEIDSLKKQLDTQRDKLNDESRGNLVKQIELRQKNFDRATQDAQEDFTNQRGEVMSRLLTKLAPVIQKYFNDHGYTVLLDTSQPWPQGPVVMSGPATDITQPIVEAFNTISGVPAAAEGSNSPKPARQAPAKSATPSSAPPKQ